MPPDLAGRRVVYEAGPTRVARPSWLLGAVALAVLGLAWEAVARLQWVPALFLPAPTAILAEAGRMGSSGELWRHLIVSLGRVGAGFGLGAAVGTILGLTLGSSPILWAIGNPVIAATYPIPKIALLPLMILWLGIGEAPKVAMIALGVFFPVVINAYAGVQSTDPLMVKAARSLGGGPAAGPAQGRSSIRPPHDPRGLSPGSGDRPATRRVGGDDQRHDRASAS